MDETPFDTMYFAESATLVVLGCIDELHIEAFRERLREASQDYRRDLVLDLSEAEFVPSTAIGVIVGAGKACARAEATLTLEARKGTIGRRVLEITGLPVRNPPIVA
jgi:anti-anti-sigma factor